MNCAFYLSRTLDFEPIYPKPVPPELFRFTDNDRQEETFMNRIYRQFGDYFPDMEYLIIDRCTQPVFYEMYEDMDVLNIPGFGLFPMLFIYATFTIAMEKDPLTLFFPGNLNIEPFSEFAQFFRSVIRNKSIDFNLLLITTSVPGAYHDYYQSDHVYTRINGREIKHMHSMMNHAQYLELDDDAKKGVSGCGEVVIIDSMKWMNSIADVHPQLEELFFLLIDAWKDQISINTVIREVVKQLGQYSPSTVFRKLNAMICDIPSRYQSIRNERDLLSVLPTDERNNYQQGPFKLTDVYDSILINNGVTEIKLEGLSGVNALADHESVHIKKQR